MVPTIRFVHCADIHLGFKQYGLSTRYDDFMSSFFDVIQYCITNTIKHIIIPGDLFHHKDLGPDTLADAELYFTLARDNGIKIYVSEGNHDKKKHIAGMSWLQYLAHKRMIELVSHGDRFSIVGMKDIRGETIGVITAINYFGASTKKVLDDNLQFFEKEEKDHIMKEWLCPNRIMMLHAGVMGFLPAGGNIKAEDLLQYKDYVSYIAIGHIHKPYTIENKIFNPGSLENCNISESEFGGGFFDVTLIDGEIKKVNHIKSNKRKVIRIYLNSYTNKDFKLSEDEQRKLDNIKDDELDIIEITFWDTQEKKPDKKLFSDLKVGPFAKYHPLIVRVVDKTTRPGQDINLEDVDAKDIERDVIRQLVEGEDFINLALEVKDARDEDPGVTYERFKKFYGGD